MTAHRYARGRCAGCRQPLPEGQPYIWSPFWCPSCDKVRVDHISAQLAALAADEPTPPEEAAWAGASAEYAAAVWRHRCERCGGYLRAKPDRDDPPHWAGPGSQDYDCRKCGETTTYEY